MELQSIRNATVRVQYGGRLFVIDPYLAPKQSLPSYTGRSPNPLVDLPCSPEDVIDGVEMVVVSHLHSDHFDTAVQSLLPKDLLIYCQPGDETFIEGKGFQRVKPILDFEVWQCIKITRTGGQHGTGEVLDEMGEVSGFVFQAANEPTVYWAGDTIWCEVVEAVIKEFEPEIIISHSCGAVWGDNVLIVMDEAQTVAMAKAAPNSTVVATHMEALDHGMVSRESLRRYADEAGIGRDRLLIPLDGEVIVF